MLNTTTRKPLMVTKRNGNIVELDYDKIHNMVEWACEGLKDVSASQLVTSAQLQFYNKMPTKVIQNTLIKAAVNLISEYNPDYQYVAARLLLVDLRKEAYGEFHPTKLLTQIEKCVNNKKYTKDLLTSYDEEEINYLDSYIDYNRDLKFTYAGLREFTESYLVRDKVKNILFETPQQAYMVIAMTIFSVEDIKEDLFVSEKVKRRKRLEYIKDLYDALSMFKISLPTPIMANCRTPIKQFASCTLIDCGDSIESIFTTAHSIGRYITRGAGIGLNLGRIRGDGSATKEGLGYSTGCIPFYKLMESATNSCSQGGIRKGASAVFFPFWHIQAEDLIPLKDSRGTESNRIPGLDYSVQLNKLFYERVKRNENITLFCPSEVKDLYEAFFKSNELFEELYIKYESKKSIKKKEIRAKDLFDLIVRVRSETGRLYIHNVDNMFMHGSFDPEKATVYQSNLCSEIVLPSKPLRSIDDEEGLIALCTLGAVNLGKINDLNKDMKEATSILVRALDNLLIYQEYPIKAAEKFGKNYRSLGVGISNLAYYLAKNKSSYTSSNALELVHDAAEALQFYLLDASCELAKERGKCEAYETTTYSKGILPIDKYKKTVDDFAKFPLKQDWEHLRTKIQAYDLRHTVLSAIMPVEKSSIISNSTNGIEAPRAYVSIKNNKNSGSIPMVVPELNRLKTYYQSTWDLNYSNRAYIQIAAIIQKFIDQAISADLYYDPARYFANMENETEASKDMYINIVQDIFYAYKVGLKTLYYHTTKDGSGESFAKADNKNDNKNLKNNINIEINQDGESCPGGSCTL